MAQHHTPPTYIAQGDNRPLDRGSRDVPSLPAVPAGAEQRDPREPEPAHRSAECPFEKPPVAAGHDVRVFLIELHEPYPARVETRADADMPEAVPKRAEQEPGCKQGEESVERRSAVRDAR